MDVPMDTSTIVSSFVTAVLFGLYLAGFAHCVRWLLFEDEGWRVRKKVNWPLVITTLLIFFFTMVWFSMTVITIFRGPLLIWEHHIPSYIMVQVILASRASYWSIPIIIDCVLIHRCWIVFSKNWAIICFPLALWCSCLICAIISLYCDLAFVIATETVHYGCFGPYYEVEDLVLYVCNILISIYTTCALVYQIWHTAKNNSLSAGTNSLYRICRILTESGILYTLSSLLNLACRIGIQIINVQPSPLTSSFVSFTMLWNRFQNDIAQPVGIFIPGIAFNLVTIRVNEERAMGQDTWMDASDANEAPILLEPLNNPDTSKAEMEEVHRKMDKGEQRMRKL